eukprot:389100-Pyramimonas_sp.AAC.1
MPPHRVRAVHILIGNLENTINTSSNGPQPGQSSFRIDQAPPRPGEPLGLGGVPCGTTASLATATIRMKHMLGRKGCCHSWRWWDAPWPTLPALGRPGVPSRRGVQRRAQ